MVHFTFLQLPCMFILHRYNLDEFDPPKWMLKCVKSVKCYLFLRNCETYFTPITQTHTYSLPIGLASPVKCKNAGVFMTFDGNLSVPVSKPPALSGLNWGFNHNEALEFISDRDGEIKNVSENEDHLEVCSESDDSDYEPNEETGIYSSCEIHIKKWWNTVVFIPNNTSGKAVCRNNKDSARDHSDGSWLCTMFIAASKTVLK